MRIRKQSLKQESCINNITILRAFPIILTVLGILIHALGMLNVLHKTTFSIDFLMFCIDSLVAFGLFRRTQTGYYLAIGLYIQQSAMQPYWAYQSYLASAFSAHPMEWAIAPISVWLCLTILITNRNFFIANN